MKRGIERGAFVDGERLARFDGPAYVNPSFLYRPWVDVAELLAELTPGELTRSFRAVGGTEAVEIALQIARAYTGREKVLDPEHAPPQTLCRR